MDKEEFRDEVINSRLYILEDKAASVVVWKRVTIGLTAFIWVVLIAFVAGQRIHIDRLNVSTTACHDEVRVARLHSDMSETIQCGHPRHRGTYERSDSTLTCICR